MYGKKRVVINKKGQIIIAGKNEGSTGGSWIPIGLMIDYKNEGANLVRAKFLKPENMFERKLADDVSIVKTCKTKKELRDVIKKIYSII